MCRHIVSCTLLQNRKFIHLHAFRSVMTPLYIKCDLNLLITVEHPLYLYSKLSISGKATWPQCPDYLSTDPRVKNRLGPLSMCRYQVHTNPDN